MKQLKFSVLMPVYNGGAVIRDAIDSVFRQKYKNIEIIICDDCSTDNTGAVIKSFRDKRIRYFRNNVNLGYGPNLEKCRQLMSKSSDVVYLMAQDDLICKGNFNKINEVFNTYPDVGAVIRPFYMYTDDINRPIRDFGPYDRKKDTILSCSADREVLASIFRTVCQLSGLAFRTNITSVPFHPDVMTSHIYPFLDIFKNHKIMYLKEYTIAVRTLTSQTRTAPRIYSISPVESWVNLVESTFKGQKYDEVRVICRKLVLDAHIIGLVQLKNYSTTKILFREYRNLLGYYPAYIFEPYFLFYFFVTLLTPRFILRPVTDYYKDRILSYSLRNKNLRFHKA